MSALSPYKGVPPSRGETKRATSELLLTKMPKGINYFRGKDNLSRKQCGAVVKQKRVFVISI